MIERATAQLRTIQEPIYGDNSQIVGIRNRILGFDLGALLALADAMNAKSELLLEILPGVEAALIGGTSGEEDPDDPPEWN